MPALTLTLTEAAALSPETGDPLNTVSLTDPSVAKLYDADREGFWSMLGHYRIRHVEHAPELVHDALERLATGVLSSVSLSGVLTQSQRTSIEATARAVGVTLTLDRQTAPRAFQFEAAGEDWRLGRLRVAGKATILALATAGGARPDPRPFWQAWLRDWTLDHLIPFLTPRSHKRFELFIRRLVPRTAQPLNCSEIAREFAVSMPTVRAWLNFLERTGVIDLVNPIEVPAPKRLLQRQKLYWTSPDMALALLPPSEAKRPELQAALFENGVYLALKDALFPAHFSYYRDTNHVTAPLIVRTSAGATSLYFNCPPEQTARICSYTQTLVRLRLIDEARLVDFPISPDRTVRFVPLSATL